MEVGGRRRQLRRRQIQRRRHRSSRDAEAGRHGVIPAGALAEGTGARADRERDLRTGEADLSKRLVMSAKSKSIPKPARSNCSVLSRGRRRRHGDQPADAGGPDPWWCCARCRPDPDGAGRVSAGLWPIADSELHGLRNAACRHDVQHRHQEQSDADEHQSAGRKGCGRGGHRRRAAGDDDCRSECARTARACGEMDMPATSDRIWHAIQAARGEATT